MEYLLRAGVWPTSHLFSTKLGAPHLAFEMWERKLIRRVPQVSILRPGKIFTTTTGQWAERNMSTATERIASTTFTAPLQIISLSRQTMELEHGDELAR